MTKNTPFNDTYRPYDGILIQVRKDIQLPDFTEMLAKLSNKTYKIGTRDCHYNTASDSITIEGFGRLPAFFFEHIVVAADFQIGELVEVSDSGQRLYITNIDTERDQVELSFISPSDGVLNLIADNENFKYKNVVAHNGDFKYKNVIGVFSVRLIKAVEGNYSANTL